MSFLEQQKKKFEEICKDKLYLHPELYEKGEEMVVFNRDKIIAHFDSLTLAAIEEGKRQGIELAIEAAPEKRNADDEKAIFEQHSYEIDGHNSCRAEYLSRLEALIANPSK